MGLKYYLNLIKSEQNCETVKLRYFINTVVFIMGLLFLILFTSLRDKDIAASSVFGLLATASFVAQRILNTKFADLLKRLMDKEVLDASNQTDAAFAAYRQGYIAFDEKNKALNKKLLLVNIIAIAAVIAFIPIVILLSLAGETALAEQVYHIASIVMLIYVLFLIVLGIFLGRKGVWYQEYTKELSVINKYKAEISGGKNIKYKLLEDKKPDKQLDYLFINDGLRQKCKKLQKSNLIIALLLGPIVFFGILIPSILSANGKEDLAAIVLPLIFGIGFILWAIAIIAVSIMQNKTIKQQYLAIKTNEDKNSLHIKLHELRTPFLRRWNILFFAGFLVAIIFSAIIPSILVIITQNDDFGLLFFPVLLGSLITLFVIYFKQLGKLRLKMMLIEDEIDRQAQYGYLNGQSNNSNSIQNDTHYDMQNENAHTNNAQGTGGRNED